MVVKVWGEAKIQSYFYGQPGCGKSALLCQIADMVAQKFEDLPIAFYGTGLPEILKKVGDTKPYGERLFAFVKLGLL